MAHTFAKVYSIKAIKTLAKFLLPIPYPHISHLSLPLATWGSPLTNYFSLHLQLVPLRGFGGYLPPFPPLPRPLTAPTAPTPPPIIARAARTSHHSHALPSLPVRLAPPTAPTFLFHLVPLRGFGG